jgi:muramoyltetrapeptide carboxypeptidase
MFFKDNIFRAISTTQPFNLHESMPTILKPQRLKKGDVIGIVTPASPVQSEDNLELATKYLEGLGYHVKLGRYVFSKYAYLAGLDKERASDVNQMFADPKVKAVFALRGGYGTPRILNLIDYTVIRRHPKIFVGFSDITALSNAIFAKTGLISFSGPMLAYDMSDRDDYTQENFWRLLTSAKKVGVLKNHHTLAPIKTGTATGRLIGGNLSLIAAILGTPYMPSLNKALFFCEDVGEESYRIDRMLTQLMNTGDLKRLAGFIAGQFTHWEPDDGRVTLTPSDVLADYALELAKAAPAVRNLTYGHTKQKLTLPIGLKARLTVTQKKQSLELLEGAVTN